jgi:hypothetical protein
MTLKDPQTIIRNLYQKYAVRKDNIIHAEKIFIINSVIKNLFEGQTANSVDKRLLAQYAELIDRYLKDEVDICWKDGKLMVEEKNLGGSNGS